MYVRVIVVFFTVNILSDPTKYFGCELGAQTTIDIRSDKFIVNGSHTADKLQVKD